MSDGKIVYELSLDAQAALGAVRNLEASASRAGNTISQSMQRGFDRGGSGAGVSDMANGIGRAAGNAADLSKQLNVSQGQMKSIAMLAGGMALKLGGEALKANGYEKEAGYLTSAGTGGLQMALTGAMMGGKKGGVAGFAVGAIFEAATHYFTEQITEAQKAQAAADSWLNSINEITVSSSAASRAVATMESPKELEAAVDKINEKIIEIQQRGKLGLMDPGVAKVQATNLARVAAEASARIPGAETAAADRRAAEALSRIGAAQYAVSADRERSQFGLRLDGARGAAEKIAIIDERFAELQNRAEKLAEGLQSDRVLRGPEALAAALTSEWQATNAELDHLTESRTRIASGKETGKTADPHVNEWQRVGGFMGGGAMNSMADSIARGAATDARRTADILTRMERRSNQGGAVWAL